jgi:hypothetical protein
LQDIQYAVRKNNLSEVKIFFVKHYIFLEISLKAFSQQAFLSDRGSWYLGQNAFNTNCKNFSDGYIK